MNAGSLTFCAHWNWCMRRRYNHLYPARYARVVFKCVQVLMTLVLQRRFRHLQCEGRDPCKGRLTCFPFIFGLNCFEFPNLKMRGMYLSPANKVVPTTSIPCRQGGEGVGDKCSQEMQNKLRLCEPSWLVCNLTFSYAFTKV